MWPFRNTPKPSQEVKFVPFVSWDLSYAKYHGLRALCGLLMDRHSACPFCPFCGSQDGIHQLIVHVAIQTDALTNEPIIALYFCKAEYPSDSPEAENIEEWAFRLTYAEAVPARKAVVRLLDKGDYRAEYGWIANPTEGDYSTGALNREEGTLFFYCDPESAHARWQYWESQMLPGQKVVPEFRCLQARGEWWIVDIDREREIVQQVAAISVADRPDHLTRRPIPPKEGSITIVRRGP